MILAIIILSLVGLLCVFLGYLIAVKKKITLLHSYHYDRVKDEDKAIFCLLSGLGVIFIGIGILASAVILLFTDTPVSIIAIGVGFLIGISFLIYSSRYNR